MSFAAAVSVDVIAFQSVDDDNQVQHTMITIQHDVARLPVSVHENPQRDSFVEKAQLLRLLHDRIANLISK